MISKKYKGNNMSYSQKLKELITNSVLLDIDEALDEIFEEIANNKEASDEAKEEIDELREFKADLEDILKDIENKDIDEQECEEIYNEILEAQMEQKD
jgi:hypothetical protein